MRAPLGCRCAGSFGGCCKRCDKRRTASFLILNVAGCLLLLALALAFSYSAFKYLDILKAAQHSDFAPQEKPTGAEATLYDAVRASFTALFDWCAPVVYRTDDVNGACAAANTTSRCVNNTATDS